jgi:SAM-dependent methyltransferase
MTADRTEKDTPARPNVDETTIASFGDEWVHFDQSSLDDAERRHIFWQYFGVFPWDALPAGAEGFDMGCGSGRWAKLTAPRVRTLNCIDASQEALDVARRNLAGLGNVRFFHASANAAPLASESQDFGYSLGVLHHVPDTAAAMAACVGLLKPGAPFLVYLYYRFDNRPIWFRMVWKASDLLRAVICRLPAPLKPWVTDAIALTVYWPLARLARIWERLGLSTKNMPLYGYRDYSFYTMRTDSRDRFGTPLEQRFTRAEIRAMMQVAGLCDICFSENEPYWVAVGYKRK